MAAVVPLWRNGMAEFSTTAIGNLRMNAQHGSTIGRNDLIIWGIFAFHHQQHFRAIKVWS
jgi:hypothetical protein